MPYAGVGARRRGRRVHQVGVSGTRGYSDGYGPLPKAQELPRRFGPENRSSLRTMGAQPGATRSYAHKATRLSKGKVRPKVLVPYVVERLQGVKQEQPDQDPTTGTFFPGYYVINKGESASAASGFRTPVYIFDLTKMNNTATGITGCVKNLLIGDAGNIAFNDQQSQLNNAASVPGGAYFMENTQNMNGAPQFSHHCQNAWYDMRFKLYGARKQSVTYDVHIVRFNNPSLIPDQTPTDADWLTRRTQFWQSIVKAYTVNSILPGSFDWKKYVTFIKSKRIALPSSTSDDLDRNAQSVDFKWFVKDMRLRDYKLPVTTFGTDIDVDSVAWPVQAFTRIGNDPKPGDRLFLLVLATDMTSVVATDDQDDSPSFDVMIRRKSFLYGVA